MNIHPYVRQLRFARSEFKRCLSGVNELDARKRLGPMNCISWIIGHLSNQEYRYWVLVGQGKELPQASGLNELVGYGKPASTPPLGEMWSIWELVTQTADIYLDSLTSEALLKHLPWKGGSSHENIGTKLQRNIYHYWFHTGEAHAVRQSLGHKNLPEFIGDISSAAYRSE